MTPTSHGFLSDLSIQILTLPTLCNQQTSRSCIPCGICLDSADVEFIYYLLLLFAAAVSSHSCYHTYCCTLFAAIYSPSLCLS